MKSYDKAAWHIDEGENEEKVVGFFKEIFTFLQEKNMLSMEGIEVLEDAMDESVALNSFMVNKAGEAFLDSFYDGVTVMDSQKARSIFQEAYDKYSR